MDNFFSVFCLTLLSYVLLMLTMLLLESPVELTDEQSVLVSSHV